VNKVQGKKLFYRSHFAICICKVLHEHFMHYRVEQDIPEIKYTDFVNELVISLSLSTSVKGVRAIRVLCTIE